MRIKDIHELFWKDYNLSEDIKADIISLCRMDMNDLRSKFFTEFGFNSNSRNKDFLVRKIAWKIQANVFGDIPEDTRKKAYEIADFTRLKIRKAPVQKQALVCGDSWVHKKNLKLARDPRLPMEGAILSKNYEGKRIMVTVLDKGFECDAKKYNSLSAIAREITGTNWNGFKFFDL